MKKQSPLLRLWQMGSTEHGGLIRAIVSAVVGTLGGIVPFYAAAQVIVGIVEAQRDMSFYLLWCGIGLAGYLVKTLFYSLALSMSHRATFSILKDIRRQVLEKLPKLPLGTVMDTSSGKIKQIVVDQIESMETTLAHLIPEMTSNIIAPVCVVIYLFVLDWRMALISLITIPVGMVFIMTIMGSYGKDFEGAVQTTQAMNETIVEYIGGIEVIKAL